MKIINAIRSPFRDALRIEIVPGEVRSEAVPGEDGAEPSTRAVRDPDTQREYTVQVADYQVVVCHDDACPGPTSAGHMNDPEPGAEGTDRSHHHDYRFLGDDRSWEDIQADVLETERIEAAGPQTVALEIGK